MHVLPLLQVDAFTTQPLCGNPCAVVFDADSLTDRLMLAIAREMNLSETAFVSRSSIADYAVRFFTPAEEIPLAGHPTIATIFALVVSERLILNEPTMNVLLELKDGPIPIEIYSSDEKIEKIVMTQRKPKFLSKYDPAIILPVFGLEIDDILPGVPIQTVSTGTPQLMVPLKSLEALRKAHINFQAFNTLRHQSDFFSPHLFCLQGITKIGHTFARHFGTPPDLLEDPFTGSATGGMAAFLWHYSLINKPCFVAEQGHWLNRPGQATVEIIGSQFDIQAIKVAGNACLVMRGELILP